MFTNDFREVSLDILKLTFADGYTTDDITYMWKESDPVQIAKGLSLPRFSIEKYSSSYCNVKTNTGKTRLPKTFLNEFFVCSLVLGCHCNL